MKRIQIIPGIIFIALVSIICGCGTEEAPTGVEDPVRAQALVDSADAALEEVLFDLINSEDIEGPDQIDFSQPYQLYLQALDAAPSHSNANFGAAVLEILMMNQDAEIQAMYDRVESFIDRGDFFETDGPLNSLSPSSGLMFRIDKAELPLAKPIGLAISFTDLTADADPTISELQDLLINELLPRLATSIARLNKTAADPNFIFQVTPRMTGDPDEDPVELDLTEVYATLTALHVQYAIINNFCAYNLGFEAYTGEAMLDALTPGSPFLALRAGGADRMKNCRTEWLDAVSSLEHGIAFLEAETDYQGDDLIRMDPHDGVTRADLDSIKHYLPLVRQSLTSSNVFIFDLDDDIEDIEISLASYFNNPVQDLKTLLPAYTVTVEPEPAETDYIWDDSTLSVTVDVPANDFYYWERSRSYESGEVTNEYENINFYSTALESVWDEWEQSLAAKPYAYLHFYFNGFLNQGINQIECNVSYDYEEPTRWRYSPVITWEADSFAEWIYPDPTFGGLLPGMTDTRLKRIFDMNGNDWQKVEKLGIW